MLPLMGSTVRVGTSMHCKWRLMLIAVQKISYFLGSWRSACPKQLLRKTSHLTWSLTDSICIYIPNTTWGHQPSFELVGRSRSPTAQLCHHALFLKVPDIHSCRLWLSFVQRDFGKNCHSIGVIFCIVEKSTMHGREPFSPNLEILFPTKKIKPYAFQSNSWLGNLVFWGRTFSLVYLQTVLYCSHSMISFIQSSFQSLKKRTKKTCCWNIIW